MTEENDYTLARMVRLKNGDDLIAEVIELGEEDISHYLLLNPFRVVNLAGPDSEYMSIALIPWVLPSICDRQEFTLAVDNVLIISPVSPKMNILYWKNVESIQKELSKNEPLVPVEPEPPMEDEVEELASKRTYH